MPPWERLPLIMAASGRGDEAESLCLAFSAPRICYEVPDYFGVAMAIREVTEMHPLELVDLAGLHQQGIRTADLVENERGERLRDLAMLFGYLFNAQLTGWRQFCAGLHLDPELRWSCLPGSQTVKRTKDMAFMAEHVRAHLQKCGRAPRADPRSPVSRRDWANPARRHRNSKPSGKRKVDMGCGLT